MLSRDILRKIIFGLVVAASPITSAYGQCETYGVRPDQNPVTRYGPRGNRCEGTIVAQVKATHIDLVNLTQGSLKYSFDDKLPVQIKCKANFESVNVRAVPIYPRPYRMDAVIHPQEVFTWDVSAVLSKISLASTNLGIYGWVGKEKAKTYVPIICSELEESVQLIVRTSFKAYNVKWRYSKYGVNHTLSQLSEFSTAGLSTYYSANTPILIPLNNEFHGDYFIEVRADVSGSDEPLWGRYDIHFP